MQTKFKKQILSDLYHGKFYIYNSPVLGPTAQKQIQFAKKNPNSHYFYAVTFYSLDLFATDGDFDGQDAINFCPSMVIENFYDCLSTFHVILAKNGIILFHFDDDKRIDINNKIHSYSDRLKFRQKHHSTVLRYDESKDRVKPKSKSFFSQLKEGLNLSVMLETPTVVNWIKDSIQWNAKTQLYQIKKGSMVDIFLNDFKGLFSSRHFRYIGENTVALGLIFSLYDVFHTFAYPSVKDWKLNSKYCWPLKRQLNLFQDHDSYKTKNLMAINHSRFVHQLAAVSNGRVFTPIYNKSSKGNKAAIQKASQFNLPYFNFSKKNFPDLLILSFDKNEDYYINRRPKTKQKSMGMAKHLISSRWSNDIQGEDINVYNTTMNIFDAHAKDNRPYVKASLTQEYQDEQPQCINTGHCVDSSMFNPSEFHEDNKQAQLTKYWNILASSPKNLRMCIQELYQEIPQGFYYNVIKCGKHLYELSAEALASSYSDITAESILPETAEAYLKYRPLTTRLCTCQPAQILFALKNDIGFDARFANNTNGCIYIRIARVDYSIPQRSVELYLKDCSAYRRFINNI